MSARATSDERRRGLPGDGFVHNAAGTVMHAVTIAAPPATVWPWLVQMGSGRAGWYSYDWIDNDGEPSAAGIIPELQHLCVGNIMPSFPGATDSFVVTAIIPARDSLWRDGARRRTTIWLCMRCPVGSTVLRQQSAA